MRHIFIIDPWHSLVKNHDSSLAMMREALVLGHDVYIAQLAGIYAVGGNVHVATQHVTDIDAMPSVDIIDFNLSIQCDDIVVWMRKDPPVNDQYIYACQLLRLAQVRVTNNPNALMSCNEKLFALEFPDLIPQTLVTSSASRIRTALAEYGQLVLKPINGKGGEGIFILSNQDKNIGATIELLTHYGTLPIIVQQYLPEARHGDKRVFLYRGEIIGAVLRVPQGVDPRANMARGGITQKTDISDIDRHIVRAIAPRLQELSLEIVGIDVIGSYLTEINITSPTCLEEIALLSGINAAQCIMKSSEKSIW